MSRDLVDLLPDIAIFVAVAKAKSISRGAQALGMPLSTVSRRIAQLEKRIGLQLIVRSSRKLQLSEIGASYLARCAPILEAAELAHAELDEHATRAHGLLRVSATPDFTLTFLSPLFATFAERYPEITFEFDLSPQSVDLIADNFDVAIRMGSLPDSNLTAHSLGEAHGGLYAAPAYLERVGPLNEPRDLLRCACIRLRDAPWILHRGDQRVELDVSGRFLSNNLSLMLELTSLGFGVVAIDTAVARAAVAAGRIVRVLPAWHPAPTQVHALTPSRLLPAKTRLFLGCLTEHLALTELGGSRRRR
jgi:DNA-binding transcriptional LysR family regulator